MKVDMDSASPKTLLQQKLPIVSVAEVASGPSTPRILVDKLEDLAIDPFFQQEEEIQTPDFALAFDIDGVLVRSKNPIPGAHEALTTLKKHQIPFILLTNGGGLDEAKHAALVSKRVETEILEEQFIQSHTPYRALVDEYQGKWILCIGGIDDAAKKVALAYGFDEDKLITSSDIFAYNPSIWPFNEVTKAYHLKNGQKRPGFDPMTTPISAILVFSSSRDLGLDIQIVMDLLISQGGVLGTISPKNGNKDLKNCGWQQDGQPKLYFCNPDVTWATDYILPRLAQGAFQAMLEGLWSRWVKKEVDLVSYTCGKPTAATYEYGEETIRRYRQKLHPAAQNSLRTIYMIGDNPESDIMGANLANVNSEELNWKSVLVESGVYQTGTVPIHKPTAIKADVLEAVRWILQQEMGPDVHMEG